MGDEERKDHHTEQVPPRDPEDDDLGFGGWGDIGAARAAVPPGAPPQWVVRWSVISTTVAANGSAHSEERYR